MIKQLLILIGTILLVSSCASSKPIVGPDGTKHQLISCSESIEDCYEEARAACGGNYKIINGSSDATGIQGIIITEKELLVKCSN